jgi:hypothetical protein
MTRIARGFCGLGLEGIVSSGSARATHWPDARVVEDVGKAFETQRPLF